ncbi:MAG: DUF87 domain-containing protein [Nanoarchaeota archaeon]|nr:DUF87 domain-containing protein [Nanoarchaeota archaeon]
MSEIYGSVISTPDGPSTRKFSFVIKKDSPVQRGQFVQIKTRNGILVARVSDIFKSNRYFENAESVQKIEDDGRKMAESFPVDYWEYDVADAFVMGLYSNERFVDSTRPASPGSDVVEPDMKLLKQFFGFEDGGIHIGKLPHHDLDVNVNLTRMLQKHMAVLALSGAGKSYLISVMIEELLGRKPESGVAVIIMDPHGEYRSFADDPNYINKTHVFESSSVKLGLSEMSPYEIVDLIPEIVSGAQRRELMKHLSELRKNPFNMYELIQYTEENTNNAVTKDRLLLHLDNVKRLDLFDVAETPDLNKLAIQGELSVVDLSDTTSGRKKQIIVSHLAEKLFNARTKGLIPPFVLIIEEAHQFAPEGTKREAALARGIITKIAREGRKFGASLCLISQRPKMLSTTSLSQCNTQFILRITNPYDLKHIEESSEGITKDVSDRISSLKVGTGLIVGEAVNFPLFVNIRKRKSKDSGKGKSLESMALEYHQDKERKKQDSKEFI